MLNYYQGNIQSSKTTIFVFGSNPEGRHGAGAAKIAKEKFGAIYGQGEGLQGMSYAIPTKDLRVKENKGYKSIPREKIIENIQKFYKCAVEHPDLEFQIAYNNVYSKSLNGYTGVEMIDMFIEAAGGIDNIPDNIVVSQEWFLFIKSHILK